MSETPKQSDQYEDFELYLERRKAAERAGIRHEGLVQSGAPLEDIEHARADRQRMNDAVVRYGLEKGFIPQPPEPHQQT